MHRHRAPGLFAIMITIAVSLSLAEPTPAHTLNITIPVVGVTQDGEPLPPVVTPVPHRHRISMTAARLQSTKQAGNNWMTANGGGNISRPSDPTYAKNCHGVTFDSGQCWLDDPAPFLNNCAKMNPQPATPGVGTVVVYKKNGRVAHTGKVIATPPGKSGVWVHSQWGHWGDFDHRVDVVHSIYGTPSYYSCP